MYKWFSYDKGITKVINATSYYSSLVAINFSINYFLITKDCY